MKKSAFSLLLIFLTVLGTLVCASAQQPAPLPEGALDHMTPRFHSDAARAHVKPILGKTGGSVAALDIGDVDSDGLSIDAATSNVIPGIQSITNFGGSFIAPGFGPTGTPRSNWQFAMVGRNPKLGGTTTVTSPIVPVSINLLDANGQIAVFNGQKLHYDVTPFIKPVLLSPIFQNTTYTSSDVPTQLNDAEQRAEFFNTMAPNWHTLLAPVVKPTRTISVPFGQYAFILKKDGTCCAAVLIEENTFNQLLFPPTPTDTTTLLGSAEAAGDITTADLSLFLFPNTFLYVGAPGNCCILGFHSLDVKPPDPVTNLQNVFAFAYVSWITPGLFVDNELRDIIGMSHEVSETFNDPFVAADGIHNVTPWWSFSFNCQDNMEVGDVIEGLTDRLTFPIPLNGRTYHPQNIALLPWFEFKSPSTAVGAAYSYPDPLTLTQLSFEEHANCQ